MASLLTLVFKALAGWPLPLLHKLGALAGWLAWLLSPTYRRNFSSLIGQAGLTQARTAAIAESGKALLELPKIWLRPQDGWLGKGVAASGAVATRLGLSGVPVAAETRAKTVSNPTRPMASGTLATGSEPPK